MGNTFVLFDVILSPERFLYSMQCSKIMFKTYNSSCKKNMYLLFGDIFIVPFLGSALGI